MDKHIITPEATVLEALERLNELSGKQMVLFVKDNDRRVRGTVTDGDIRRALVGGASVADRVTAVMRADFAALRADTDDRVAALAALRSRRISLVPVLDAEGRLCDILDLTEHRTLLPVDAVIMAGGRGERLRPLTLTTPKPLLPLGGKAIIDHNIERLEYYGVKNIFVTVNYLKEQIEEHCRCRRSNGRSRVICIAEERFLGTIGALRMIYDAGSNGFENDTVLVMNSDIFTNIDFESFYLHFKDSGAAMSVAAVPYTVAVPYGILDLDNDVLKGVTEKPTFNYYANGGIYLIKRKYLGLIPEGVRTDATDLIEALIEKGLKITRFPISGTWIDIGTVQEYRKAGDLVSQLSAHNL